MSENNIGLALSQREKPHFQGGPAKPSGPNLFYIPSHFPCTFKAQERKVPYKRPLKEGHVEGYHQNLPGFLGAFLPPHRFLPSVHLILGPWLTLMASFSSFLIIYNYSKKKRESQKNK
jgi:hypothetical protein